MPTDVPLNLLEEIQNAQTDPGPDRKKIAESELPVDPDAPILRVHLTDSTGYVRVYHIEDKDVRVIPKSVLTSVLQKKLPDGRRAFTTAIPAILPKVGGMFTCRLHISHPDAAQFFERGYHQCDVSALRTEMDVELHLEHKHKSAARWWKGQQTKAEHDQAVETQRMLAEAISLLAKRRAGE